MDEFHCVTAAYFESITRLTATFHTQPVTDDRFDVRAAVEPAFRCRGDERRGTG